MVSASHKYVLQLRKKGEKYSILLRKEIMTKLVVDPLLQQLGASC
jgi:hypothetical protein